MLIRILHTTIKRVGFCEQSTRQLEKKNTQNSLRIRLPHFFVSYALQAAAGEVVEVVVEAGVEVRRWASVGEIAE
ncbi:hypothetical protein DPMN_075645 [Dreissena polymorpha]|uniref:Uncharacterized protein n=1 Tax=Dreissena polymorpha TaxID=45954 RepID=A0A9D4BMP9_DREPO|nr:hypothetical protein DPMN_075645 [Dreissena polymorpha]